MGRDVWILRISRGGEWGEWCEEVFEVYEGRRERMNEIEGGKG